MSNENQIICPSCQTPIDITDAITKQLEDAYEKKFKEKLELEKASLNEEKVKLNKERETFDEFKNNERERINEIIKKKLEEEKKTIESKVKTEFDQQIKSYEDELNEKSKQLIELNKLRADMSKLEREKQELKTNIEAEAEKKFTQQLNEKIKEAKEKVISDTELKIIELQEKLAAQVELTEQMKKKQEQGSMQLQGEVQEIAIQQYLETKFVTDEILEIKKGQRGADILHAVKGSNGNIIGKILYESKRAKHFAGDWISKLKQDMRAADVEIGVIVTDVFPADVERVSMVDGVWICSYTEFKGLCFVLRQGIVDIDNVKTSDDNKETKMGMLYDYLVGNKFRAHMEAIVEGFSQMQDDLTKEKKSIMSQWSKREAMLEKVLLNTTGMYGSIKGIAGSDVSAIKQLEPDNETNLLESESNDEE